MESASPHMHPLHVAGCSGYYELFSVEGADAPRPMLGFHPHKPTVSPKDHKPQMHLMPLTGQRPSLSLAPLHGAQNIPLAHRRTLISRSISSHCLPLFLPRSRGHRWVFCRHDRM